MPMVNGKKYAYTPAGKAAAAAARKKADPALSYTADKQRKDRQAVQDEYARKYDPIIKESNEVAEANRFFGDAEKQGAAKRTRYAARMAKKGAIADQNRWIARGAKANAIAIAKSKKKASGGWEEMTGMTRAEKIAEMRKAGVSEAAIKAALGE